MRMKFHGVYGEITTLPGCSQVAVSHGVFTPEKDRGHGNGERAMLARLNEVFNELGYDYVLCTVEASNQVQTHILRKAGWKRLAGFKSRKTGHMVYIFGRPQTFFPEHVEPPRPKKQPEYVVFQAFVEGCKYVREWEIGNDPVEFTCRIENKWLVLRSNRISGFISCGRADRSLWRLVI